MCLEDGDAQSTATQADGQTLSATTWSLKPKPSLETLTMHLQTMQKNHNHPIYMHRSTPSLRFHGPPKLAKRLLLTVGRHVPDVGQRGGVYWAYMGIMENKMETTVVYWDNGKSNGNYYSICTKGRSEFSYSTHSRLSGGLSAVTRIILTTSRCAIFLPASKGPGV